ncbi:MAG: nucleotidyl transferase AbiEii/AbiGii toxin family protein, partial [Pseudomonadota bacterium]|jgi:hypothetical protein
VLGRLTYLKLRHVRLGETTTAQIISQNHGVEIGSGGVGHGFRISFFGTIGLGRVGIPERTADNVLLVASLDDLMATKLKVILQRAEAKDYRDIAAMLAAGVSLERGLSSASKMYGPNFQPGTSLRAMTYFDDGNLSTLSQSERNTLIHAASNIRTLPEVAILSKSLTINE